jgi:V8-like Glu-specific endopeptidase
MLQNAQALLFETLDGLLIENRFDDAAKVLLDFDKANNVGISDEISSIMGAYKSAERELRVHQTIDFKEFSRFENSARRGLQTVVRDLPNTMRLNGLMQQGLSTYQFDVPEPARLEKIIGQTNNLLKINWLEKALAASKAVCRVVCADGELGTGFLTKEGFLFTNNHVIPTADIAKEARIEFNYQLDASGKTMTRTSYQLDASTFVTSKPDAYDYARIKVIDRADAPLRQWGFLEFDPSAIPAVGDAVTIIQHPKGEDKQIALNANEVLGVWNQHVFYTTDTEPGSSGSPVFNKDWKVIAIHHAGKTEAEGGLQVNARGDRKGANRGILFENIFAHIAGKPLAGASSPTVGKESTEGLQSIDSTPEQAGVTTTATATVVQPSNPTTTTPTPPQKLQPKNPNGIPHLVLIYDAADSEAAKNLKKHLTGLTMAKKLTLYLVHQALAGEDVLSRASEEIAKADVVGLLISSNLYNDEAIWLAKAVELVDQNRRLVPIRVDDVSMQDFNIGRLRALPTNKTIAQVSRESSPDAAWKSVADELSAVLK